MANEKTVVVSLSETTAKAVGQFAGHRARGSKVITAAVDGLIADGVTVELMKAPEKDGDKDHIKFYNGLKAAVVSGFSVAAQGMIKSGAKGLKSLGDAAADNRELKCKENSRYWQQQIGSTIKDLRNSLTKRVAEDENKADPVWEDVKRKQLDDILTQAQKRESSTCDLVRLQAVLKDAIAILSPVVGK